MIEYFTALVIAYGLKDQNVEAVVWFENQRECHHALQEDLAELFLFKAEDAIDLKMDGLKDKKPEFHCMQPFRWDDMFFKIAGAP